jgi:hypothetical protein
MARPRNAIYKTDRKAIGKSTLAHAALVDEVLLQPWFLSARVANAIHGMVPPDFHRRMRYFFDDYGCMICGAEVGYHSNGMCRTCRDRVRRNLVKSVKRRAKSNPRQRLDLELFKRERLARKLLGAFPQRVKDHRRKPWPRRHNPVYEALAARHQ